MTKTWARSEIEAERERKPRAALRMFHEHDFREDDALRGSLTTCAGTKSCGDENNP